MNKTENLKLNVWEKSDPILVGDFNEDNRKIDAAVAALDAKAARVEVGSYTGTGTFGREKPNSLTFSFQPKFVFVVSESGSIYENFRAFHGMPTTYVYSSFLGSDYGERIPLTWEGNTLRWYATKGNFYQLNTQKQKYVYIAVG